MILAGAARAERFAGWRWAAAAGVALLLAYAATVSAVGQALEPSRPDLAVRLAPTPSALGRLAQRELAANRPEAARAHAARALQQAPLDVRALRVYALSLPADRAREREAMMAFAGERSWRDNDTQFWLLQARLTAGDARGALRHADALLRRLPKTREPTFPLLVSLAADPRGAEAITERLATRPNWRPAYLAYFAGRAPEPAAVVATLKQLTAARAGPTDDELRPLLARLVRSGRAVEAAELLQDFRPAAPPGLLRDGEFDGAPAVEPFAWALRTTAGLDIGIGEGREPDDRALWVDYDGYSQAAPAHQMVALAPGAYRLSGQMRSGSSEAGRLVWRVSCAAGRRETLGQAPAQSTQDAWRAFSTTFTVPATDCPVQWIALVGSPGPRRTSISAMFDSLSIAKITKSKQAEP